MISNKQSDKPSNNSQAEQKASKRAKGEHLCLFLLSTKSQNDDSLCEK